MKRLEDRYLGWVAGIVDGEGHIGLGKQKQNGCRRYNYHPTIHVTNTNYEILNELEKLTSLGIIDYHNHTLDKYKKVGRWRLRKDEQKVFLPIILPYLIGKALQAELLIEYLALEVALPYQSISEDVDFKRRVIWLELEELNRKGRT